MNDFGGGDLPDAGEGTFAESDVRMETGDYVVWPLEAPHRFGIRTADGRLGELSHGDHSWLRLPNGYTFSWPTPSASQRSVVEQSFAIVQKITAGEFEERRRLFGRDRLTVQLDGPTVDGRPSTDDTWFSADGGWNRTTELGPATFEICGIDPTSLGGGDDLSIFSLAVGGQVELYEFDLIAASRSEASLRFEFSESCSGTIQFVFDHPTVYEWPTGLQLPIGVHSLDWDRGWDFQLLLDDSNQYLFAARKLTVKAIK